MSESFLQASIRLAHEGRARVEAQEALIVDLQRSGSVRLLSALGTLQTLREFQAVAEDEMNFALRQTEAMDRADETSLTAPHEADPGSVKLTCVGGVRNPRLDGAGAQWRPPSGI